MNDRIKELAEQSEITQYVAAHNKYLERFAELIVRECIKITRPNIEYPNEGNDWEQGFHVGKEDAADYVKQHFGVEE